MIRILDLEDVNDILYVINESNRDAYRKIIPPEFFKEPILTCEELVEWMHKTEFFGYLRSDKIVAVASMRVEDSDIARFGWIYVLPKYQRRGIGTTLIRHLEDISKRRFLTKVRPLTVGGAEWAIRFYQKLGYQLADRVDRPWGFDQYMEKLLV